MGARITLDAKPIATSLSWVMSGASLRFALFRLAKPQDCVLSLTTQISTPVFQLGSRQPGC